MSAKLVFTTEEEALSTVSKITHRMLSDMNQLQAIVQGHPTAFQDPNEICCEASYCIFLMSQFILVSGAAGLAQDLAQSMEAFVRENADKIAASGTKFGIVGETEMDDEIQELGVKPNEDQIIH